MSACTVSVYYNGDLAQTYTMPSCTGDTIPGGGSYSVKYYCSDGKAWSEGFVGSSGCYSGSQGADSFESTFAASGYTYDDSCCSAPTPRPTTRRPTTDRPSVTPTTDQPTALPSAAPITHRPTASPITHQPTEPTLSPTTGQPTEPTASPSTKSITGTNYTISIGQPTEPTASPSTKSITGTNYTISIVFHSCVSVYSCNVDKTMITSQVHAIVDGYINYDTQTLSTNITGNEVVIILAIGMDEYNSLLGERISDRIESELEDIYSGDIDVTVKETNDTNDTHDTEPSKEENELSNILILSGVIVMILILTGAIITIRQKHARNNQNMVQKELEGEKMDNQEQGEDDKGDGNDNQEQRTTGWNQTRWGITAPRITKKGDIDGNVLQEIEGKKVDVDDPCTQEGLDGSTGVETTSIGEENTEAGTIQTSKGDAIDDI
eukprot:650655_1